MTQVLSILAFFWSIRIAANILTYIALWYVKEYRFDRMRIHLRTRQGRGLMFMPFRRPPITPKSVTLLLLSGATLGYVFTVLPYGILLRLLILDICTFPVIAVLVGCMKIPTAVYHRIEIFLAVRKLRKHSPMTVIGITGSYGKTSTKEILSTILSHSYTVLKTESSKNSPVAIAELLLKKLKPDHDVFVVEMGAYKTGEIAEMCRMVRPQIGILTAINAQHQDLFGSIENTMRAKYELMSGLTGRRTAIINMDNARTREMGRWAEKDGIHTVYYSAKNIPVHVTGSGISFSFVHGTEKAKIDVPLLGVHNASNVIAALTAAMETGMPFADAVRATRDIRSFDRTMQKSEGRNGSVFIDDTFNNNPEAAIAAIDFLSTLKHKKILVFQPMIELGRYAGESHEKVGKRAGEVCDEILLTNANYLDNFIRGVHSANPEMTVRVLSAGDAAAYIVKVIQSGDTVLFKGKESAKILQKLKNL